MAWGKIQENAPDVYYLLSKLYFDKETLNNLLQKHIDSGGNLTSQEIACDWLQQSRDIWLSWLPSGSLSKVPVYLGGMFPLSESEDVVWSRPGILQGMVFFCHRLQLDYSFPLSLLLMHLRVNPLSANSDQQQFSPNNIHTLSRDKVMRINIMITIEKML